MPNSGPIGVRSPFLSGGCPYVEVVLEGVEENECPGPAWMSEGSQPAGGRLTRRILPVLQQWGAQGPLADDMQPQDEECPPSGLRRGRGGRDGGVSKKSPPA